MKKIVIVAVALAWVVAVMWIKGSQTTISVDNEVSPTPTPKATLLPALVPICTCESGLKHFEADGSVKRGRVNPQDIGLCQINHKYHNDKAVSLGWDIYTEEGNILYANYLYSTQGSTPWNWSKSCWSNK